MHEQDDVTLPYEVVTEVLDHNAVFSNPIRLASLDSFYRRDATARYPKPLAAVLRECSQSSNCRKQRGTLGYMHSWDTCFRADAKQANWLHRTGIDLASLGNVSVMANTPDPRDFYRVSRLVLLPSLWLESFPRVAVEAMINGIPVLGSRRGGIPEALADAGFLFDVPDRYTPQSRMLPSAQEVAPWIETILRLWDDPAYYEAERRRCLAAAEAWQPEQLLSRLEAFFTGVVKAE